VKNVRQAHECQDHGETQQIDDDLEFLVDGLKPVGATSSRYLSAISLAKKCTNPTFRYCTDLCWLLDSMWVILLNLLHTGNLRFVALFHNSATNEHGVLPKTSKISVNTLK